MSKKYEHVPAADLVEDFDVYPRENVDTTNIARLADVIRSGNDADLRVVADKASKRIVDGFHTRRAYIRVLGKEATVPVEWRHYSNDAELYADAARLNAKHGKPIMGSALTHALFRGIDLGLEEASLADIFGIRKEKVSEIVKLRMGHVRKPTLNGKKVTKSSVRAQAIPLKNSVRHLWGQNPEFTPEQAKAHDAGPGTPQWLSIKQVADYIEHGLIDLSDARVVAQLDRLRNALASIEVGAQ